MISYDHVWRHNGLRLSCNRASHVSASSGWPGAVDSSKRVLRGAAAAAAEPGEKRLAFA
jgi:hypothetical protein